MKTQLLALLLLAAGASASTHTATEKAFTCPVGGETFSQTIDTSGTSFGMMTDMRPVGPIAAPFAIPQCPKNKFVMFKSQFSKAELAKFERVVNSAEYQQIAAQSPSYLFRMGAHDGAGGRKHRCAANDEYFSASELAERKPRIV